MKEKGRSYFGGKKGVEVELKVKGKLWADAFRFDSPSSLLHFTLPAALTFYKYSNDQRNYTLLPA